MNRTIATAVLALALHLSGCSHHQAHHARGQEHWHEASDIEYQHDGHTAHRLDSHKDRHHGHTHLDD